MKNLILATICFFWFTGLVQAVSPTVSPIPEEKTVATVSADVLLDKGDITKPENMEAKSRLEMVLDDQQQAGKAGNIFRQGVRLAVERGISANVVVLLLMLPVVATVIAAIHYVLGISGFGIFTPAMVAVAFLSTGVAGGLALFAAILVITTVATLALRRMRLHYWPRRAMVLLAVCLGTLVLMVSSSWWGYLNLTTMSIFPVLILILVTEDFVRTQLVKSKKEAKTLALGTLIMAIAGAGIMASSYVQSVMILYPEVVIVSVVLGNLLVGRYKGMRYSELHKFGKALR